MNKTKQEPDILFLRERITIGTEERSDTITVSELVKKNQPLVSCPAPIASDDGRETMGYNVRVGRNTHLSDDGKIIIASISGYPRIDLMKHEDSERPLYLISLNPFIRMADNNMVASLVLHPLIRNGFSPRRETLPELLKENGIIFGLDRGAILEASQILDDGCSDFHEIPVAYGQPPISGTDEYLDFAIETGPIAGKMLKNGTIDFRERRIMIGVAAGDLIATRVPSIPGTPGINVLGQDIEAEGGREIGIDILDDTSYSIESGEIRASKNGILTIINDSQIRVCAHQEIESDIDYETGHIASKNSVSISGAVQPGFRVETVGDLLIKKEVMSATITSQANVVIKGGITGHKTSITAQGDVDILFIEQGSITAGGNVIIRKQTYYSDISAGGDIRYQNGSNLVGGAIVAGGQLTVANVGSLNCTPALLAAGVDIERLRLYDKLKQDLTRQQKEIIQWLQRYGGSIKSKKIKKMEEQVTETKLKLIKLNMIPGTMLFSRAGEVQGTLDDENNINSAEPVVTDITKICIDIHGTIYAGTRLRIGNRTMTLGKTVANRRFKLKNNLKQLIAIPIRP